jgi:hypothetical protein
MIFFFTVSGTTTLFDVALPKGVAVIGSVVGVAAGFLLVGGYVKNNK